MEELKVALREHYLGAEDEGNIEFGALVADSHPLATGTIEDRVKWVTDVVELAGWPVIGFMAADAREVQRLSSQLDLRTAELQREIETKMEETDKELLEIEKRWGVHRDVEN
jgi:hypothetical protein